LRRALAIGLPALALVLLAAHFYRAGVYVLAAASFALIVLLFVAQPWAARLLRGVLLLGTIEWLRTAWVLAAHRAAIGQPSLRMLAILGSVAAVTAFSAVLAGRLGRDAEGDRREV
jgi:hypothetical protein